MSHMQLVNAVRFGEAIKKDPRYTDPPQEEMRQMGVAGIRGGVGHSSDEPHSDPDTLTEESEVQN